MAFYLSQGRKLHPSVEYDWTTFIAALQVNFCLRPLKIIYCYMPHKRVGRDWFHVCLEDSKGPVGTMVFLKTLSVSVLAVPRKRNAEKTDFFSILISMVSFRDTICSC